MWRCAGDSTPQVQEKLAEPYIADETDTSIWRAAMALLNFRMTEPALTTSVRAPRVCELIREMGTHAVRALPPLATCCAQGRVIEAIVIGAVVLSMAAFGTEEWRGNHGRWVVTGTGEAGCCCACVHIARDSSYRYTRQCDAIEVFVTCVLAVEFFLRCISTPSLVRAPAPLLLLRDARPLHWLVIRRGVQFKFMKHVSSWIDVFSIAPLLIESMYV